MQKTQITQNQKGFSLIELMIVVAIIGLLAAIGIPQYAKFQAKARQSEAKGSLTALFSSQKSFQSEWQMYTVNLRNAGFGVEGTRLRYTTGFVSGTGCTGYNAGFVTATGAPNEPADVANTQSQMIAPAGTNWETLITNITQGGAAFATYPALVCTAIAFTAFSIGDPNNNPVALTAASDTWSVDQNKRIANTVSGIR